MTDKSEGQCRSDDMTFEELQDHIADAGVEGLEIPRDKQNWNEGSKLHTFAEKLYEALEG